MPKRKLLALFAIWLALIASLLFSTACAIKPPDTPVCFELSPTRGYCVNTISTQEFEVSDSKPFKDPTTGEELTWWAMRPMMILLPVSSWVRIKAFILKVCHKYKCDDIGQWETTVEKIDDALGGTEGVLP